MLSLTAIQRQAGVTIYELMITVLIVGLVVVLGLPNLNSQSRENRLTVAASDLRNAFKIARSEAMRSGKPVTICASDNATAADADCRGNWQDGYIVFADLDGNLVRAGANETLISVHSPIAAGVQFAVANDARYFSFAANGAGRGDIDGRFAASQIIVCDDRGVAATADGKSAGRLLVVTPLGHTSTTRDVDRLNNALRQMSQRCE